MLCLDSFPSTRLLSFICALIGPCPDAHTTGAMVDRMGFQTQSLVLLCHFAWREPPAVVPWLEGFCSLQEVWQAERTGRGAEPREMLC